MRRLALPLLTTIALAALAACGGGASPTPAASSAALPSVAASAPAESAPAASAPAASTAAASPASAGACAVAPAGGAATVNATIKNFQFSPQPIQAKVGDVVAWKNDDSTAHTVTMDAGTCDSGNIGAGASAMLVFTAPGTYAYHCKIHPAMTGFTVEVK
jgi:plastocyanin